MFYSKSTGGFYSSELHAGLIPSDAVKITIEEHSILMEGQSKGKVIVADKFGRPVLQDPPTPSAEQMQDQANKEARAYLAGTDWYIIRMQETGEPTPAGVLAKREEARARVRP